MYGNDRALSRHILLVVVVAAAVLLIATGVQAQVPASESTLTLPDAIATALQQNPTQVSQRLELKKAEREQDAAHGAYWPQLDFGASATRYGFPTFVIPIRQIGVFPPLDTTIYQYGVALHIPLYVGGRLDQTVVRADIGREIARERDRLGNQELVFNVSSAYLKVVHLGSLVAAYDARIASLDAQQRRVALLNKVGRAARLDLLKVSTLLTRARYERLQVENRRREAYSLLYNLMGTRVPSMLPNLLAYRVPVSASSSVAALEHDASAHRPELRIAEQQTASARAQERIARGERLPSVAVVGQYFERAGSDSEFFNDWNVGVQFTVPILDGGVRRAREEQAAIARAQAEEAARRTRLDVSKQVRDAVNADQESAARLQATASSVAESIEALSIERLKYEQGVGVVTDLLDAESAVLTAQAERLQAQFDAVIAKLNLLKVAGRLDADRVVAMLTRIDREN
jgi:outer membrane protein